VERYYELKLADGREETWPGSDGVDAARRFVDCHGNRGGGVVAWREPRVELVIGVDPQRIIG
jgi:hypothetical protein